MKITHIVCNIQCSS